MGGATAAKTCPGVGIRYRQLVHKIQYINTLYTVPIKQKGNYKGSVPRSLSSLFVAHRGVLSVGVQT